MMVQRNHLIDWTHTNHINIDCHAGLMFNAILTCVQDHDIIMIELLACTQIWFERKFLLNTHLRLNAYSQCHVSESSSTAFEASLLGFRSTGQAYPPVGDERSIHVGLLSQQQKYIIHIFFISTLSRRRYQQIAS